ncbi:MAG TPA: Hpt domain-containing protein [Bryobacteraceae bacterium]|nr:Hpt domain-containing protein [Bryobacteraceae bacterium]
MDEKQPLSRTSSPAVVPGASRLDGDAKVQGSVEDQLRQLDQAVALSRVGGDFDLLREVVELFLTDYPQELDKIRAAAAAHDPHGVEYHAHSLKGSVSTFGARGAFEAALALERKGRSGDLTDIEDGLSTLELALRALRPELEALQNK